MAIAIVVLAIPVAMLNWPDDQSEQGPPPPLTIADANGLDDNQLVDSTNRNVLWQMVGKDKELDAWRQAPDPVRHVYVLATGGSALATSGIFDWCIQQSARGELPTLREIEAAYIAIGLQRIAKQVASAACIVENRSDAIRDCAAWDPACGRPRPPDPFVQVQDSLVRELMLTDSVKQLAVYIRSHISELLAPSVP